MLHSKLRPFLGLPRLLTQAAPPFSLVLLAMTLLPLPASASYWNVSVTDKGDSQSVSKGDDPFPWTPPDDGNNYTTFYLAATTDNEFPPVGSFGLASVTIDATITMTWVADPPGDPAPNNV